MATIRRQLCVLAILCIGLGCQPDNKQPSLLIGTSVQGQNPQSLAYRWADVILDATARDTERFNPRPTVTSRFLGLIFTAIYDAWSRYDSTAAPVYLQANRIDEASRTDANKAKAISYAAYRAASEYFYSDTPLFIAFMDSLGYDPANNSLDPSTPEGIGNLAAKSVIDARRNDGANQYGDAPGSDGKPYHDYTNYTCANTADVCNDINRWQPKYFISEDGSRFAPGCLTPHWGHVKPLALSSASKFRSPPPPLVGSEQLEKEVREVVELQANITDEQRALVEFMRDGPASVQQAGHWLIFAQDVSRRDAYSLDQDVQLFFLITATAMDCFIACWDTKMHYDYARPYALVHHYMAEEDIVGWEGPDKGMIPMKGKDWRPYSPDAFLCPPFPAYVSGHSTVSAGCAKVLELFTGSDEFGEELKLVPGLMTEPQRVGDTVTIQLHTFSETAAMAGFSRVLGGYHIQADNVEGLKLGEKVGAEVFDWYNKKISGDRVIR
jgi:hypothetical protein